MFTGVPEGIYRRNVWQYVALMRNMINGTDVHMK